MTTRSLVALVLFVIAGLPLIASRGWQVWEEVASKRLQRDAELRTAATDIAEELRVLLESALDAVRADASLPGLEAFLHQQLPPSQRLLANRFLTAMVGRDPVNTTSIALLDRDGINRADSSANQLGGDESAEPYFAVMHQQRAQLFGPWVSAGEQTASLYLSAPIRAVAGAPVGVLRVRLEPARIGQTLHANLRIRPNLGAAILDQHDRVFARAGRPLADVWLQAAQVAEPHDLADQAGVLARAVSLPLPPTRWRVVVHQPQAIFAAPLGDEVQQAVLYLGLLSVSLAVAAWLLGWLLSRPLSRLTTAVDGVAAGSLARRLPPTGTVELRHLAEAVNSMQARLQGSLEELALELRQRQAAETSLRASEERLSTLIEQIPGAVYRHLLGTTPRMIFLSRGIETLSGYPVDDLLDNRKLSLLQLIHPDDRARIDASRAEAIAGRQPYQLSYRLIHRDGSQRWLWERGQAHYGDDGSAQWLDGVLFDVSDKERAEQSMRALRSGTEGLFGQSYFASLTRALCDNLELHAALLLAFPAAGSELLAGHCNARPLSVGDARWRLPVIDPLRQGEVCVLEHADQDIAAMELDGWRPRSLIGLPMRGTDGRIIGGLLVLDDRPITDPGAVVELLRVLAARAVVEIEREQARAALQQLASELEHRVAQRTAELQESHARLSQAMNQLVQTEKLASLGSLVAGIAHELNTPIGNALTAASSFEAHLNTFAQAVASGSVRRSTLNCMIEDGGDAGAIIQRNLHRAAELIGHFKQVAVDTASSRRRRFDLRATIEEVLSTLHPRLKRLPHRVELEVAPGISLDSVPGALEQVLTNLICNSLDHAFADRQHGNIRIHAQARGEHVMLSYQDDGSGIPVDMQKRVFDPFFTTRLGSGGSGLGLYLVHTLVTGPLGGRLSLHSQPGAGSRFELWLPRQAPESAEVADVR